MAKYATQLLLAVSVVGLAVSVFDYFWTDNGIHGTPGVLLVIGSTLLMGIAMAAITFRLARGHVKHVLAVLVLLDILGTGFAAYMLEAWILFGLMIVALLAWLFSALADERPAPRAATAGVAR
jgi:hypothetical protein